MTIARRRVRVLAAAVVVASSAAALTSCASEAAPSNKTSKSASPGRQVVTVVTDPDKCVTDPSIVNAGKVTIKATAVGDETIQVTVFGPKDGQFSLVYGTIPRLRPGTTKSMTVDLEMGAYEIACADDRDDERSRLTAI